MHKKPEPPAPPPKRIISEAAPNPLVTLREVGRALGRLGRQFLALSPLR